jgi:soluble lytic murein transglycosylase
MRRSLFLLLSLPTVAWGSDALIREAADANRRRDLATVQDIAGKVRGHPLELYPQYWAMRLDLESVPATQIDAFAQKFADSPLATQLRVEWLNEQAKRDRWDAWTEAAIALETENQEFQCFRAQWLLKAGKMPQRPPDGLWADRLLDACADAFAAYARAGHISADDVLLRFRLVPDGATLYAAQAIASALPTAARPDAELLARAHAGAAKYLAKPTTTAGGKEAALYAMVKLARNDVDLAAPPWDKIKQNFSKQEQSWAALQLGVYAARQHNSDALKWFAQVADVRVIDAQAAWWVRAALRAGDWKEVLRAIATMSEAGRNDPTWAYWRGRALATTGDNAAAKTAYESIRDGFGFYNWLAAEELGTTPQVATEPFAVNAEQLARFEASPAAKRAVILTRLNLRFDSAKEWYTVVKDLNDTDMLAASVWMQRQNVWDRAIAAAERTKTRHDHTMRFMIPFRDALFTAAKAESLEPTLVAALTRQESRFAPDVVSSAGAVGLMQLMPNTAKWVAKKLGRDYVRADLEDPELNAKFGAYYLRTVKDGLAGSPVMALAAYNAGPGRAKNWQSRRALEGAIYTETILFNETRDYVKKVLVNAMWMDRLSGGKGPSLKARLGTIPAEGESLALAKETP